MRRALGVGLLLAAAPVFATPPTAAPVDLAPYFPAGSDGGSAASSLRLEQWAAAADGFAPLAAKSPQAAFLCGYAELKARRYAPAATRFDALVAAYPLLADYHRLFAARAL